MGNLRLMLKEHPSSLTKIILAEQSEKLLFHFQFCFTFIFGVRFSFEPFHARKWI